MSLLRPVVFIFHQSHYLNPRVINGSLHFRVQKRERERERERERDVSIAISVLRLVVLFCDHIIHHNSFERFSKSDQCTWEFGDSGERARETEGDA